MREDLLPLLGETLRNRRRARKMTQPMLASRVGRSTPRISDLEKDLLAGRLGKDRLGLLAEVCDALDLVPVLVPREQAQAVRRLLGHASAALTLDVYSGLFDDDLDAVAERLDQGARAAATICGLTTPRSPSIQRSRSSHLQLNGCACRASGDG